jgi:hypothetical protein
MSTTITCGLEIDVAPQPIDADVRPTGFIGNYSNRDKVPADALFLAVQRPRHIVLHRDGCLSLSKPRAPEGVVMSFDSAHTARDWLISGKHSWQNSRACGGAKKKS